MKIVAVMIVLENKFIDENGAWYNEENHSSDNFLTTSLMMIIVMMIMID